MQQLVLQMPSSRATQSGYRGRVRSGCLTCRSRKVKCDELRPVCQNCKRLKRSCVYKPRKSRQYQYQRSPPRNTGQATSDGSGSAAGLGRLTQVESASQQYPSPSSEEQDESLAAGVAAEGGINSNIVGDTAKNPFQSPDSSIVDIIVRLHKALRRQDGTSRTIDDAEFEAATPSTLISRDIELTTTIDVLATRQAPLPLSFAFFVDQVDCPAVTPFDGVNWRRMKAEVVGVGTSNEAVAEAIVALSALYKGQMYGLPLSKAMCLYKSARLAYEKLLGEGVEDFEIVLVTTFLLSLFESMQYYETDALLREPGEKFIHRLEAWTQSQLPRSSLAIRIIVWLRLLHTIAIRGGGMGLISDRIYNLFSSCSDAAIPSLAVPSDQLPEDKSTHLYETIASSVFDFYFRLQMISGEIAKLTHYHRSRTAGADQEDVTQQIAHITLRLHRLWDTRSAAQRQTPGDLRAHLESKVADPIIALVGMCHAAYHAEFIEIGRVLGDPVSEFAESRQAMRQMREIVDGDWNVYQQGRGTSGLKTGYLRPLFLYAIECMDREESQWAVERLESIRNPICRSDFFAVFARELSEAQLRKERRVTTRFFCMWHFGVPPPFL
ncbi:hypothetical protein M441DRAFT_43815 [Trichoderma asperellum CBS 433.97]|uniref:Zn(2)-C6 fungal-type domain-containing protein n=1 Tax=Trichoderma asperellum (strain ATCC 204424 / CBS 433.97 / NBRC 101777) TaxID=1042311 RepID=A0A2T3ZM07_TRIA4|nr:hypothetical protein M441DRAFT_43815 [Trichoderma asperellum CBS 433.97]PTB45826.1 hypothetical protein M441DRAFT_43815 [Trichoderma asperellum CBS 433.97]